MELTALDQVRRFHRTVTQRIGALEDAYLSRARPLGHARVLWEIGTEGRAVRALRARLGLDSGYLSRLLRALETEGLVSLDVDPDDKRVRTARLTPAGLVERAELDRRSDDLAAGVLRPLSDQQRERLVAAMAEVDRLLTASVVAIADTNPRHPAARYCMQEYFAELGRRFDGGFDPDRSIPAEDAELTSPAGVLLLATLYDEPVGCGALKLRGEAPAEVKRMWVSPRVRGLGLGRRLLAELETRAAGHGVHTLRLETNGALDEAIGLYRAAGYDEVGAFNDEPYAHHWFEKTVDHADANG